MQTRRSTAMNQPSESDNSPLKKDSPASLCALNWCVCFFSQWSHYYLLRFCASLSRLLKPEAQNRLSLLKQVKMLWMFTNHPFTFLCDWWAASFFIFFSRLMHLQLNVNTSNEPPSFNNLCCCRENLNFKTFELTVCGVGEKISPWNPAGRLRFQLWRQKLQM